MTIPKVANMAAILFALVVLAVTPATLTAQKEDPFKTSDSSPFAAKNTDTAKADPPEKVVVHTPTLELVIQWTQMNRSLAHNQVKISELGELINGLREQSEPDKDRIGKLEKQRQYLRDLNSKNRNQLMRIPYDTTFDLERWEKFQAQMKAWRESTTAERLEKRLEHKSIVKAYEATKQKNELLQAENDRLRAELDKLKNLKQR